MSNVLDSEQVDAALAQGLPGLDISGQRLLLIIPDKTRTAPVADLVQRIVPMLRDLGASADILVALGTHPQLPENELLEHVGLDRDARPKAFTDVKVMNHAWDDPETIVKVGEIPRSRVEALTDGHISEDVELTLNRIVHDYDRLLVLGPVFPHEIAGFSGGAKYLFPGISGIEMINFFHWLGAIITSYRNIGTIDNPVRQALNEAAALVPIPVDAISIVVHQGGLAHLSVGPLTESWRAAAVESAKRHILRKPRQFQRALSCCPRMYEDMWTGGKCMYKLEPVIEDGGEIVIYAPHVDSLSVVHGAVMKRIGYHVVDYFLEHMDRYPDVSKTVMSVAAFVRGSGTYTDGVERPRIDLKIASRIPQAELEDVGLGYADPEAIDFNEWKDREDEGILFVERAGETLYVPECDPRGAGAQAG